MGETTFIHVVGKGLITVLQVTGEGRKTKFIELDKDGRDHIYTGCKGRTRPNFCRCILMGEISFL
jgi:hypothetical protein